MVKFLEIETGVLWRSVDNIAFRERGTIQNLRQGGAN